MAPCISRGIFIGRTDSRLRERSEVANNIDPRANSDQLIVQRFKKILNRDERGGRAIGSRWVAVVESKACTLPVIRMNATED